MNIRRQISIHSTSSLMLHCSSDCRFVSAVGSVWSPGVNVMGSVLFAMELDQLHWVCIQVFWTHWHYQQKLEPIWIRCSYTIVAIARFRSLHWSKTWLLFFFKKTENQNQFFYINENKLFRKNLLFIHSFIYLYFIFIV